MSLAKGKRTAEWLNIGINKPIIIMIIIYWAPSLHQMQSWIPYMCFFNPYNTPGDRHNYLYFTEVCLLSQWLISAITIEYQVHHPKWWHELWDCRPDSHSSETFLLLFSSFLASTFSLLYSFNKCLLSTYYARQALGIEYTVANKAVRVFALLELAF